MLYYSFSLPGPMVWYQKFEYAIGHWLQKAAEHMLGCVLCSPGCFSLFRGSAIMDDNVMRTYATKSTEARHYVQYDQGRRTSDGDGHDGDNIDNGYYYYRNSRLRSSMRPR